MFDKETLKKSILGSFIVLVLCVSVTIITIILQYLVYLIPPPFGGELILENPDDYTIFFMGSIMGLITPFVIASFKNWEIRIKDKKKNNEKMFYVWCPNCAKLHDAELVKDLDFWELEHYDTE